MKQQQEQLHMLTTVSGPKQLQVVVFGHTICCCVQKAVLPAPRPCCCPRAAGVQAMASCLHCQGASGPVV